MATAHHAPSLGHERRDVVAYFVFSCGITWALDLPLALAWFAHRAPPSYALGLVGLGAFGPTLAAFVLARRRGVLRDVFGRWRARPAWVVLALFAPLLLHLPATVIEVALGGHPAQWFYPPDAPERFVALIFFSFGEEFGWRGFAHPRITRVLGPVFGSLVLGAVWGAWHIFMMFTPERGAPDPFAVFLIALELALYSVVIAWVFERNGRSMAVAIAFHMGGHLDNVSRAPETELRLRLLRIAVVAIAALFAARGLTKSARSSRDPAV